MSRSELRELVMLRDRHRCMWPFCGQPAVEMAHFHSIGSGGRKSADTLDNVGAMCRDHARISDGEYGSGGAAQYRAAHLDLLGCRYLDMPQSYIGFERAEALAYIARASRLVGQTED